MLRAASLLDARAPGTRRPPPGTRGPRDTHAPRRRLHAPAVRRPPAARALALAMPLLGSACMVDAPDLAGKQCPCAAGWSCDPSTNLCFDVGDGAIVPTSLRAVWTTPESIRWEWDASGPDGAFLRYELVTATDVADLGDPPGPSARVWTPDDNPELGAFRRPRTIGDDQVLATTTDEHEFFTEYVARLTAIDTQQRRAISNVASGRTTSDADVERALFVDELPAGAELWPYGEAEVSTDGASEGSACMRYVAECGGEDAGCFVQVHVTGTGGTLVDLSQLYPGPFGGSAFVELAVAHDSDAPSFWSQVRFRVGGDDSKGYFEFGELTVPNDGEYHRYQVPLRALLGFDAEPRPPFEHADLAEGLYQFSVGGNWSDGATVRIDEARLRW
jgi:hypothetical protein